MPIENIAFMAHPHSIDQLLHERSKVTRYTPGIPDKSALPFT